MDPGLQAGLLTLASVGLFLAAAKFHGRAVRLRREYDGYLHVDFRRPNPPAVEALWRRDRIRFWSLAVLGFLTMAALLFAGAFETVAREWRPPWRPMAVGAWSLLGWNLSLAFVVEGLWIGWEHRRHARRVPPSHASPAQDPAWARQARQGTRGWLLLCLALAAATLLLALL